MWSNFFLIPILDLKFWALTSYDEIRKRGIKGNGDEPPAKIAPAAATAQPNVDEEAAQVTAEPQPAPVEAAA